MKIKKIIVSSDDNPIYLSYWKINAKVCKEVLGLDPVLFWITEEDSDFYYDGNGMVKKIKKLPDFIQETWGQTFHSSSFQAQNVRLWATKFFPEEVCILSDIDLLLFNPRYLEENTQEAEDDDLVILGSDAYDTQRPEGGSLGNPRYAVPYVAAKGNTFVEILDLESDFKNFIQKLACFNWGGWTDELYLGKMIDGYGGNKIIHRNRRGYSSNFYCNRRIERKNFFITKEPFNLDLSGYLDLSNYIDVHLPGPYDDHKEKVDNLLKYIEKIHLQ